MRQTMLGLAAAVAVITTVSAAPAMACGGGLFTSCSPCAYAAPCAPAPVYVAPAPVYSGCNTGCGGWAHERLPDPVHQYYYVNQGPTFTGPGNWAPRQTYQESAISGWRSYHHRPHRYGYVGGRYASPTNHYYDGAGLEGPRVYRYRAHRHHRAHHGYRHTGVRHGYAPRHKMHHRGHHQYPLRRYY